MRSHKDTFGYNSGFSNVKREDLENDIKAWRILLELLKYFKYENRNIRKINRI